MLPEEVRLESMTDVLCRMRKGMIWVAVGGNL